LLITYSSVSYDSFDPPNGDHVDQRADNPNYLQFNNEAYRHCKAIAFAKGAEGLAAKTFIKKDKGIIFESEDNLTSDFILVMKRHRIWEREKSRKVPA